MVSSVTPSSAILKSLLASKTDVGMSNMVKVGLIGAGVLVTIVVLLKVRKK